MKSGWRDERIRKRKVRKMSLRTWGRGHNSVEIHFTWIGESMVMTGVSLLL